MKLQLLLVVGIAIGLVACAKKEEAVPAPVDKPDPATPAVTEAPAAEAQTEAPEGEYDWRSSDLLDHMHKHAEQLDELNFALDDGDLDGAMTPAYWLSQHDTVSDLPSELQVYVYRMREAASAVEQADDLETARAAAQRVGEQCQACHTATGVDTGSYRKNRDIPDLTY